MITLVPLHCQSAEKVEALLDRAFGPERQQRTAYRVRGGASAIAGLSFAAVAGQALLGSIQCWPVVLTTDAGGERVPLVMVGPVAVDPTRQRDGIGRQLVAHSLLAAAQADLAAAMTLIGDPEYYGRFFGFTAERTGGWRLPGPVDRRRLLARGEAVPAVAGTLGAVTIMAG